MKKILLGRINLVLSLSAILAVVLLAFAYTALAQARRGGTQRASSATGPWPAEQTPDRASRPDADHDDDPEFVRIRGEFLSRFFGTAPGTASPPVDARPLPPSRLLQGRRFTPAQAPDMSSSWTFPIPPPIINSYGGNASALIQTLGPDPTTPDVIYTGSSAGLAKSSDGGETWNYLSDNWASQAVSSIAVDPNAPDNVYVGTGSDYAPRCVGLYRSFDGGLNWTLLGVTEFGGTAIRKVVVDPNSSGSTTNTTLYVANGRSNSSAGLWRSTDSGATWTRVLTSSYNGIWDLAIDSSTDPSTLYIADEYGVSKGDGFFTDFYVIYPSNVNWNSGVRLSLVDSAPYLLAPNSVAWPNTINKLYTSPKGNQNWTEIPTLYQGNSISPGVYAVDPADPDIILIGTNTLFRTVDKGASWDLIGETSAIHPDQRAIAFSTARRGVVFSGNDGGISKSMQHGENQTWINLNQNFSGALLYTVALSQDGSLIAGTQDNGAVFSDLGGPLDMIWAGDSFRNLIDPADSTVAYISGFYMETLRRYNKTDRQSVDIRPAQLLSDPACNFFPAFSMNRSSPTHLIAACQHLVQSTDRGDHWTTIGGPLSDPTLPNEWWNSVGATAEAPSNPNVIYAVALGGRLWVTSDAGHAESATWTDVTGNLGEVGGIYAVVIHPTNPQIAYLACGKGIYKTTTMGTGPNPWTMLNAPAWYGYKDLVIDPADPNQLIVASDRGVLSSANDGEAWEDMSAGIPAGISVTGLSFTPVNRHLVASTYGRGVYLTNLPPVVAITSPANGAFVRGTITFSATASEDVVGVQFKLDGVVLGAEDTVAPYSVTWNTTTALNGNHTLAAVARNADSSFTTSAPVTVTVDNAAPTVSITSPATGATVSGMVTVSATASDNVGVIGVQFKLDDGDLSAEDTTALYSISWDTAFMSGSHALTAVARDAAGNTATSAEVTVKVIEAW